MLCRENNNTLISKCPFGVFKSPKKPTTFNFKKLLTEEILSITAGSDQGSYAKPLLCKRYPLTRGCSQRKSLFLNFAENAKVAATGFERETRGNLLSLSNASLHTKRLRPPWHLSTLLALDLCTKSFFKTLKLHSSSN